MSKNLETRIRRLEGLKPRRGEFENMADAELRAFIVDETRALLAECGSIDVLIKELRAVDPDIAADEMVESLGFGLASQSESETLQ